MNWKRSLIHACLAQCCGVLCLVGIRNLGLPFFMKAIGFTDSKTMMCMSFLSLGCVFQLILSLFASGYNIKKLLIGNYIVGHVILGALCGGYLFFGLDKSTVLIGTFAYFIFTALGDTFWWPFIHPQIPGNFVASFFTRLRITWATFSFIGVIILKRIVNSLNLPTEFALFIFLIGFLGLSRVLFLFPLNPPAETLHDEKIRINKIWDMIKKIKAISGINFIFFFVVFEPLFLGSIPVLFLNDLGVPKGDNFLVQAVGLLSTVVSLLYVNNTLRKVEEKKLIRLLRYPLIFLIICLPLISLIEDIDLIVASVILIKFLAGIILAGIHLIYINRLFKHVDKKNRTFSMGLINVAIFGTFFISEFTFSILLRFTGSNLMTQNKYIIPFMIYAVASLVIIRKLELNSKQRSAVS